MWGLRGGGSSGSGDSVPGSGMGGGGSAPSGGVTRSLWIPYCTTNSDQRSNTCTSSHEFTGRADCLKLIRELNRETSNYRHLAVGLGGSGDCDQLRDDLKRSRRRAQDLAKQAKNKLSPHIQETDTVRPEVARLWRILFCCIRVLEQEMLRTLTLQHTFGLHIGGPVGLINTGVHEYAPTHHHHHRSAGPPPPPHHSDSVDLSLDDRLTMERAEVNQLQKELIDLRNLINVMESSLDMKGWILDDLTEKQLLATISDDSNSYHDPDESGCSDADSVGEESAATARRGRYLCWAVLLVVMVFLFSTLAGILVAFLT